MRSEPQPGEILIVLRAQIELQFAPALLIQPDPVGNPEQPARDMLCDLTTPLPLPPLPGNEWIVPLTTPQEFVEEARAMQHCVISYLQSVREGQSYIYRVQAEEPATLELQRGCSGWEVVQLRGYANGPVSTKTRESVADWLQEAMRVPASP